MVLELIFCCMALFANCEWLSFFNSYYRNKKDIQVIVDSSLISLLAFRKQNTAGGNLLLFSFWGICRQ